MTDATDPETLAAAWHEFLAEPQARLIGPLQTQAIQATFYSGAHVMLVLVHRAFQCATQAETATRMDALTDEIKTWLARETQRLAATPDDETVQ